jgi:2-dehydro-3-deoxyphosphogluconate aldolase/(4S)-4-hydroxy-2-oxoglutarate aldolase
VAAGAKFLVAPVFDPLIIAEAARLGVAMMPGCATPTEMLQAYRCGAALQKLFPAPGTGPVWVAQTLGPLPFLRIVPTSGVTLENAPADVKAGRWDIIESRARAMLEAVRP